MRAQLEALLAKHGSIKNIIAMLGLHSDFIYTHASLNPRNAKHTKGRLKNKYGAFRLPRPYPFPEETTEDDSKDNPG